MSIRVGLVIMVLQLATWSGALAHGPHHARLDDVNDQLREDPDHVELLWRRAELQRRHGDVESALRDYDRIVVLSPNFAAAYLGLAYAHLEREHPSRALRHIDTHVELDPTSVQGHVLRATVLAQLDRPDDAVAALARARELDPHPSPDLFVAGARFELIAHPGEPERALHVLGDGITRLGDVPVLHLELARVCRRAERWTEAIAHLDHLTPDDAGRIDTLRGHVLREAGRVPEAMVAYTDVIAALDRLSPDRKLAPAVVESRREIAATLRRLATRLDEDEEPPTPHGGDQRAEE